MLLLMTHKQRYHIDSNLTSFEFQITTNSKLIFFLQSPLLLPGFVVVHNAQFQSRNSNFVQSSKSVKLQPFSTRRLHRHYPSDVFEALLSTKLITNNTLPPVVIAVGHTLFTDILMLYISFATFRQMLN